MKISLALGTLLLATISLFAQTSCGTVTDIEGNTYKTVQIGSQCWMAENLRTKHFADGETINKGLKYTDGEIGNTNASSDTPYWYYPNGDVSYIRIYGLLYNWEAATKACPKGWHLPSDEEWEQLKKTVGNNYGCNGETDYCAKALSSKERWKFSDKSCHVGHEQKNNNVSGFSALPAGAYSNNNSRFFDFGERAFFWNATEKDGDVALCQCLHYNSPFLLKIYNGWQGKGFSVRCIRDKSVDNAARTGEVQNKKQNANSKSDNTSKNTISYENAKQNNQKTTSSTPTAISSCGTVKDYDGNTYKTVQIGGQCWMAEELRAETYSDGSRVSYSNPDGLSGPYTEKWFCYYKNGHSQNKLYYWGAAVNYKEPKGRQSKQSKNSTKSTGNHMDTNVQGLCPSGWHIPSQAEWEQLRRYLRDNDPSGNYATHLAMIEGEYYWTSELRSEESYPLGFKYQKSNEWSFQEYKRNLFVRCVRD